jgi:enediyne biosynthesis protein E4
VRANRGALLIVVALVMPWAACDVTTATGATRKEPPARPGLFVDVTGRSGIGAGPLPCALDDLERYFVTGQAWADVDQDGIADLYLTSQCGPSILYRGLGDARFEPSPLTDRVALADRQSGGAAFADLDADGWPDLLVLTYDGPVLFHNEAGRDLVDVTAAAGLVGIEGAHPMSAALADYDGDGALDIFLSNYGCVSCLPGPREEVRSQLFHALGGGRFEEVSDLLGESGPMGMSFVGGWADVDTDGDPDLYVTNDVRGGRTLHGNALYRNDGAGCGGWCFTDTSRASGADVRADAMGLAIGDLNGDGSFDLYVTNSGHAYTSLTGASILLAGRGDGTFHDVTRMSHAAVDAMTWAAAGLDANDDGWTDLYVALGSDPTFQGSGATTNRMLLNLGRGRFRDATRHSGAADVANSFGLAVGDANDDGQADIVVGDYGTGYRLYLGTGGGASAGHRLVVRLRGAGAVNPDAVGARIEVDLSDGRRLVHEVALGGTLGGNHDPAFRTGTGVATVTRLTVRWPDGTKRALHDVPPDSQVGWTFGAEPEVRPLPSLS